MFNPESTPISAATVKLCAMKTRSSTRLRRRALIFCGAGLLGAACAFGALMAFLDSYGQSERAQPSQAIVVLGSRVRSDGQAGNSLRRRALKAAQLYKKGIAPFVICTGGVGDFAPSEAYSAAQVLQRNGVPSSAILLEDRSHSTWQNIENVTAICQSRGWTQVVVVSEPFHLWRARRNFADFGIRAFPSPAANAPSAARLKMAARECLSVTRDFLSGR